MGKSYSSDLRDRVVAFVEAGGSRRGAARQFGVSNSFAVKLSLRWAVTNSSSNSVLPISPPATSSAEKKVDVTLLEVRGDPSLVHCRDYPYRTVGLPGKTPSSTRLDASISTASRSKNYDPRSPVRSR
jgi:hypothetical protein